MSHILNVAVKWVLAFLVLLLITMLFGGYHFTNLLIFSFGVAVISYVLGDLLILPKAGNIITSIADFAIAFGTIWLIDFFLLTEFTLSAMLYSALIIAIGEFLFHIYLEGRRRARFDF